MLLAILAEAVFSSEIPVTISQDGQDTQEPPQPEPPTYAVVGTLRETITINENSEQNTTFHSKFSNLAYEIPFSFQFLDQEQKIKIFSVTGDDAAARAAVQSVPADVTEVEFSKKTTTPLKIESPQQTWENSDAFAQVNYRYIYSKRFPLSKSEVVFLDSKINENAVRFVLTSFGSKTALFVDENDAEKIIEAIAKAAGKKDANMVKFVQISQENALKISGQESLSEDLEALKMVFGPLHDMFKAENILVVGEKKYLSLQGVGLAEIDNKISSQGADFLACLAVQTEGNWEQKVEICGFYEICSQQKLVCDSKNRKIVEQKNYVSLKWRAGGEQGADVGADTVNDEL